MMRKNELDDLKPIKATVWLKWFNSRRIYKKESLEIQVDVRRPGVLTITGLPEIPRAKDIGIQVLLNIAVVTNSIPNTGISLPFISYGGSSILFLLTEMGIVFRVSSESKTVK